MSNIQVLIIAICSKKYCGGCKNKISWAKSVLGRWLLFKAEKKLLINGTGLFRLAIEDKGLLPNYETINY